MQPIFVDVYSKDLNGAPKWDACAKDTTVNGAILKATESSSWGAQAWLAANWKAIHDVSRDVGTDWFCGAYHYLHVAEDGAKQADWYMDCVEAAGGLAATDLWPIVDLETKYNENATRAAAMATTQAFVDRVKARWNRSTMLYAGSFLGDHSITSRMGCNYLWTARYTHTLPQSIVEGYGWTEDTLWGWQYQGTDGPGLLANYPTSIAGFAGSGKIDLTVMVFPGGLDALKSTLASAP